MRNALSDTLMRIASSIALGLIATCYLSGPLRAESVPATLRNKTISLSWVMQRTVMTPHGERQSRSVPMRRTIYVSTAGRFFVRASHGRREGEEGPGDRTHRGGAREFRFSDGKVISMVERRAGAGRMTISFDRDYTSCSIDFLFGKQIGQGGFFTNRRGFRVKLLSVAHSERTCSIRSGNAFAD
jgi:hypothetical protein